MMLILNSVFTTNVLSCFAEAFATLSILDMEITTICNLITEVTSHYFRCILLIRSQSRFNPQEEGITQRCERQETRITGWGEKGSWKSVYHTLVQARGEISSS